jgi:hypothetical protein
LTRLAARHVSTLDIMGLAGFGYEFHSLSRPPGSKSELATAFEVVFQTLAFSAEMLVTLIVPAFEHVPTPRNRSIVHARKVMDRIGRQLLEERKAQFACVPPSK